MKDQSGCMKETKLTQDEVRALAILRGYGDRACYESMIQTLLRGMAAEIDAQDDGVMLRHRRGDIVMVAARTDRRFQEMLARIPLGTPDVMLHGMCAPQQDVQVRARLNLKNAIPFYQYAYYGEIPGPDADVDIRPLTRESLDFVYQNYGHASREYLDARIRQGVMLGAYVEGALAGFIGEHVEGSMGLLHVMPAYRRMHLGYALERAAIRRTRLAGQIPFDQVAKTNDASIALQARLGMTRAKKTVYWITDDTY